MTVEIISWHRVVGCGACHTILLQMCDSVVLMSCTLCALCPYILFLARGHQQGCKEIRTFTVSYPQYVCVRARARVCACIYAGMYACMYVCVSGQGNSWERENSKEEESV